MVSTVQVKLFGSLRKYGSQPEDAREVRSDSTVESVLLEMRIPPERIQFVFVNGQKADADTLLHAGDTVGVFPALGGG